MKNPNVIAALKRIAKKSGGILKPEEVVDAARPETSPLHNSFCWDDTEAAANFRIWQARVLIRTTVKFINLGGKQTAVRVFVSLTPDRLEESGGYRVVASVLNNKEMRDQMLADALEELRRFELKYSSLKELAQVFQASRQVRKEMA